MKSAATGVIAPSPVRRSTYTWLILNWRGRSTRFMNNNGDAWNLFSKSARHRTKQEMPTPNSSPFGSEDDMREFRMPIELSTYPDRSPVLSEEERQEIAYLLTLSPRYFHAFEQHAARITRVTQPLIDLLKLFRQWRPTSYIPKQYFMSYLLDHVLQSDVLYWGWSGSMWESVIDAIPLRPNAVALRKEPGYT